jgi:hypothetical protein
MRIWLASALAATIAGCATLGVQEQQFRATAVGPVSQGVECVTREAEGGGWTVTTVIDAGLVRAERGADWIEARIFAVEELSPAHIIEIETGGSPVARDLASGLVVTCGN